MKKIYLLFFMGVFFLTLIACETEKKETEHFETIYLEGYNVDFNRYADLPTPSIEGEKFLGWAIDKEGSILVDNASDYQGVERLYPIFEKKTDTYPENNVLVSFSELLGDALEKNEKAMIGIMTEDDEGFFSSGSGIIYKIEGNEIYLITNHHVIENGTEYTVFFERFGNLFEVDDVELIGSDVQTDVALLKFSWENTEDFNEVVFADSSSIKKGNIVIALGMPLEISYFGSATLGIVSHPSRFFTDPEMPIETFLIQHDAAISPGNSGGALFNEFGEVLGINTLKIVDAFVEGMGFSVPSNTILRIVEDLEEFGYVENPFLGISSTVLVVSCGVEYGVCIEEVLPDSSAETLELEVGDIIIGFENVSTGVYTEVFNFQNIREAIVQSRIGDDVKVEIIRDGQTFWTNVGALGARPDFDDGQEDDEE